jgi:hypothetical protein
VGLRAIQSLVWAGLLAGQALAATIDQTCATCGRRVLDSANLTIDPVRVNQVGYRNDDPHKRAYVGSPKATTFSVVRSNGTVAYSGTLQSQGTFPYKGRILIKGYYNSITPLYQFQNTNDTDSASAASNEAIWTADFGALTDSGTYRVAVGTDTSHPFDIRMTVYNDVFENTLKYFGIERSGDNDSWMHGPSHLKDGSGRPGGAADAGSLAGGWYDCGDYFKVGQTDAYAFTNLMLAYTLWPQKAEDRYGSSYLDTLPFGTDGIPDLLREAKIGADYIVKLYRASVADGLIAKNDMYQEVGVWDNDHQYWDQPERQDVAPVAQGGPPRPVDAGAGSAVAAAYAGSLALFAKAWIPFDPVYADSCLQIAKTIYAKVVIPNWKAPGYAPTEFYTTQGRWDDDLAWAATGLWYATGDTSYKYDLTENTTYGNNPGYIYNIYSFKAGFLALKAPSPFSPGGWPMDYQNTFIQPIWALWDLFYKTDALAAKWKIQPAEAQDMRTRILSLVGTRYASESTNGGPAYAGTNVNVMRPYDLVWTSITWGMNRYNLGGLLPIVAYHEMIKGDSAASAQNYWNIILDNMNYNLGANPWDISFQMGAGSKNLQHPHNRISNPEGYNAGGIPYPYRSPKGALMGGSVPGQLLRDEWDKYDVTETCIDFAAQVVLPSQYLAEDLPPDTVGPAFSNVVVVWVSDSSAIISWQTDKLSMDSLYYSLSPGGPVVGTAVGALGKNKTVTLTGLSSTTTYYFWFKGTDIYNMVSSDNNRGRDYQFTTTSATAPVLPTISDVKVCNIVSDQATVYWWTDVASTSEVDYHPEATPSAKVSVVGDDEGIPARFHKVTLKGLTPNTAYRFDVVSGGVVDDSGGLDYRFVTGTDFANYTIQIKATTKNAPGAHFYVEVANNENKPYVGLQLRLYFQTDATTAAALVAHTSDDAIFGVTGTMIQSGPGVVTIGSAVAVAGMPGYYYLPIVINDTLPVAGRARIELKMDNSNWNPQPWSIFTTGWSLVPHTTPVAFPGVDMTSADLWAGPDEVEMRNGAPVITYVQDPYIAAYSNGVHIYGYTPDGDLPKIPRTVAFTFTGPLPSPATSVVQDTFPVHFSGRTWGTPDVTAMNVQRDGPAFVPTTPISGRVDSVSFAQVFPDPQGTTSHEWAFWADRTTPLCACAWQRYNVTIDTMKVPPRSLHLAWSPAGPVDAWTSQRKPIAVFLLDSASDTLDTVSTVALSAGVPGLKFWSTSAGATPTTTLSLLHGTAQLWVSDSLADTTQAYATASIPGSIVTSGAVTVRFSAPPPWPSVDSAWTVDANCDGVPDSVEIRLSSALDTGASASGLFLALGGVTDSVPMAGVSASADGRTLLVPAPAGLAGSASGSGILTLHVTTGNRNLSIPDTFAVSDRVPPLLLSASVLERFAAGNDTVRLEFSEPVQVPAGWPFQVVGGTAPVSVLSVRNVSPTILEWALSGSAFPAGSSVSIATPGALVDFAGNPSATCSPRVPVVTTSRPDPMVSAVVRDPAGIGEATDVTIRFARAVRDQDLPDSLVLLWGVGEQTISGSLIQRSPADSSVLLATLAVPSLSGSGSLPGGAGQIVYRKGIGASGTSDTVTAADSVGPALRTATLRTGTATDTLVLRMSEFDREGPAPVQDLQVLRGLSLPPASIRIAGVDSAHWTLLIPAGLLVAGDSLRLSGVGAGAWSDRAGNSAAPSAPWVPLHAGDRSPVVAWASDLNGDGLVDQVTLVWSNPLSNRHPFLISWPDSNGAPKVHPVDSASGSWSGDTLRIGVLWPFGATFGPGAGQQLDVYDDGSVDTLPFAIADSAAPVVVDARLGYAAVGATLDTLVVRFSEPVRFGGGTILRVRSADGTIRDVVGVQTTQSGDGRTAWITLDATNPAYTVFQKGDAVQAYPGPSGVRDTLGNTALETGHFQAIAFGQRPPRFSLDFLPGQWVDATGGTTPTSPSTIQVLVRAAGSTVWTALDGSAVDPQVVRIGPHILSNGPLGGDVILFDNLGTHVASRSLDDLMAAGQAGTLPVDPSGQWEAWIAWDGRSVQGRTAASGVYAERVILRRPSADGRTWTGWLNKVYRIGWLRKN